MKLKNAERIAEWMRRNGYEVEIRPDYSGREMFVDTTTGIVCDNSEDCTYAMGAFRIKDSHRVDHMGRSYIVY